MQDKTNSRFDKLLKAMVQGEPPKRKANESERAQVPERGDPSVERKQSKSE
jgi:hypothetical protein